jgi:hypothetical protein
MEGTLRLRHRTLNPVFASFVRLVPLPVFDADPAAFDLDGGHADTRPQHQQVDFMLRPAVAHLDGMGQHAVIRQAVPQRFPHCPFG